MRRLCLTLIGILCFSCGAAAQELSKEDKIFFQGVNAGKMEMLEFNVVEAFAALSQLKTLPGAEPYRRMLVTKMNAALVALSSVDREVTLRPQTLREAVRISSPTMKGVMKGLKQARIDNQWQMSDPKEEQRIGWVLDRYIRAGNLYGFE